MLKLTSIQSKVTNSRFVNRIVAWSNETTLPGFQGVSLGNVVSFLYREVLMDNATMTRANAIAFSFFMSLFPSFLVLFSLIPYVVAILPIKLEDILSLVQETVDQIMPNKTGEEVFKFIKSFLKTKRSDFLSIGFVLAIYFSSNGLMALMKSFEKNYAVFRRRGFWEKRFSAIGMTLMLGILLVITTLLVILGNQIFSWLFKFLKIGKVAAIFILLLKWVIVLMSVYVGIALIYRFGIASRRRLHFFSPGASTAAILSLLSSIAFSFYVDNFGNYNKVYGSFVGGIVLLLWLQLNAVILIIGFELNAAIAVTRDLTLQKMEKELDVSDEIENDV
jgi:membrane protein